MILWRNFSVIEKGKMQEAVALVQERAESLKPKYVVRIATNGIGTPRSTICVEIEYESLAAMEKHQTERAQTPAWQAFAKKWDELTAFGGHTEIWYLK